MNNIREFNYFMQQTNFLSIHNGFNNVIEWLEDSIYKGVISYLEYIKFNECIRLWIDIKNGGDSRKKINEENLKNAKDMLLEIQQI